MKRSERATGGSPREAGRGRSQLDREPFEQGREAIGARRGREGRTVVQGRAKAVGGRGRGDVGVQHRQPAPPDRRHRTGRGHSEARGSRAAGVVLLLIDVINGFDFSDSQGLVQSATRAVRKIERLAQRARDADVPVIYVNDNFGQWRSDFSATVAACTSENQPGRAIALRLRPREGDYFVLKPRHSGFYSTTLELLLEHLGARTLILLGFTTNQCVLFTANDAHMRGYHLVVAKDCTASKSNTEKQFALAHIADALAGQVVSSAAIDFRALSRREKKPRGQAFEIAALRKHES